MRHVVKPFEFVTDGQPIPFVYKNYSWPTFRYDRRQIEFLPGSLERPLKYYHLESTSMDVCHTEADERPRVQRELGCPSCRRLFDAKGPLDLRVDGDPPSIPLDLVPGIAVLARRDFAKALGSEALAADSYVGKVYFDGVESSEFVSIRAKNIVVVRGKNPHSTYRICPVCHRAGAAPVGTKTYLAEEPAAGVRIFESQFPHLVVTEDIYERVRHFADVERNELWANELAVVPPS